MSFLDNLENSLKALESREEKDPQAEKRRAEDRAAALAAQPFAEALKSSPFTEKLFLAARTIGHQQRTLVRFTWLDTTLRLEAKDKKLDLKPTAEGIVAIASEGAAASEPIPVSLDRDDPESLAANWLK
jgi:hypothetical protein